MAHRQGPDLPPLPPERQADQGNRVSSRPVPERVAVVLRRALVAEQVATGERRIPAFRLTRYLLAGARDAGCAKATLADCLGISRAAVRTRGGSDGWVAVEDFAALADLDPQTIEAWASDGLLQRTATDDLGHRYHAASELMRALVRLDPPDADPA